MRSNYGVAILQEAGRNEESLFLASPEKYMHTHQQPPRRHAAFGFRTRANPVLVRRRYNCPGLEPFVRNPEQWLCYENRSASIGMHLLDIICFRAADGAKSC